MERKDEILSTINENILEDLDLKEKIKKLDYDTTLQELGLDSIVFVRLIVEIENIYDIEFEDEDMNPDTFGNIESLICYIENRLDMK